MPFAYFRRHQRTMLAVLAIMAMFVFVLADSLPNLMGMRGGTSGTGADTVVATLFGKPVKQKDLERLKTERYYANRLWQEINPMYPMAFGDLSDRSLVDAYILQHEADRLGIPADVAVARKWIRERVGSKYSPKQLDAVFDRVFGNNVSASTVLESLANQLRLLHVSSLAGEEPLTPLDIWRSYRDTDERVSVQAVEFRCADFVKDVPDPSAAEIEAMYAQGKDLLPDPARDVPGFKIPRRIQFQYLMIDGESLMKGYRAKLTEAELRDYLDSHRTELEDELLRPVGDDLPFDLFADDPKAALTPRPFGDIKPTLENKLADETARAEIDRRFNEIRNDLFEPYEQKVDEVRNQIDEAKEKGKSLDIQLPKLPDAAPFAKKLGLELATTPSLEREAAATYELISTSKTGLEWPSRGRDFVEEFFDTTIGVNEPVELTDSQGRRYLAWKMKDDEAHTPPLSQIRDQVVQAVKMKKARELAQKEADRLARQAREHDGKLAEVVKDRPVITTAPVAKKIPAIFTSQFQSEEQPVDIKEIPYTGDELRELIFHLKPGDVQVGFNQPKTICYVITLVRRDSPSFAALFSPNGSSFIIKQTLGIKAMRGSGQNWMELLRKRAGLSDDWIPPDEKNKTRKDSSERRG